MPRAVRPARLWLRPAAEDRAAIWIILDCGRQIRTGCGEAEGGEAEKKFRQYLATKHDAAPRSKRRADQTPISDVLSVYLDDIVPQQARPAKVAARIGRLVDWWGGMMLSEVAPATCRAYVAKHSKGGGRRDLEDLRAAINHHAKRDLHSGYVEVSLPAKGKPRSKYLTRDEVARLLWVCWRHTRMQKPPRGPRQGQKVASQRFYDLRHLVRFILMGVYTGSRTTPILRASIYAASGRAYIDLAADLYHRLPEDLVEAENKKSPTSRLGTRIAAHIRRWRDRKVIAQYVVEWNGKPVKSVKTAWKQAVKLAKIGGNPTPHTLRHTCVTWLKQAGESSFDVAGFTGMSEQMVERVYGKHDPDYQRSVANAFKSALASKHTRR
jgi:integrase